MGEMIVLIPAIINWYNFALFYIYLQIVDTKNPQIKGGKQALGLLYCLQEKYWQLYEMSSPKYAEAGFQKKNLD